MNVEEKDVWNRILDGTLDIDHAEVKDMEKRSPQFAQSTQELREVQADLTDAGVEMRSILEEAQGTAPSEADLRLLDHIPGAEQASEGGLRESKGSQGERAAGPVWPRWIPMAAAVLIAVSGLVWYQSQTGSAPDPRGGGNGPVMGTSDLLKATSPVGPSASFEQFVWEGPTQLGSWYVVHVVDLETQEVTTSAKQTTRQWTPETPLTATKIRWYTVLHDPSKGEPVSSPAVEASR